jgi:TetR/AcrR family transcriptional regulator
MKSTQNRLQAGKRRCQLLDTALDCFSQRGFRGTTTKEIAAAAGVTEAIVFRHFPSKQALYEAVLADRHESAEMQEWLNQTKACMDQKDDAGLLRTIAMKILESHRRDARMHRLLLFAALQGDEQALAYHRQLSIPVYELLCQYVKRRQSEGKLLDYEPGMILVAISGMANHFATMTRMFGFPCETPDETVAGIFTSMLLNGIQPTKERLPK